MKMNHTLVLLLLVPLASQAAGKPEKEAEQIKTLSGISIVGNNETPKSLSIVPWKSSEVGGGVELNSGLLNEEMMPVDREVFRRELVFFEISNGK